MARDEVERSLREAHDRGDKEEVTRLLVASYGPEILGFLAVVMRDEEAARDVFSQVTESIWRHLERFGGRSTFRTWAYAIARNAAFRARQKKEMERLRTGQAEGLVATPKSTTRPYLRTENKERLAQLRATLDPESQALLTLRIDRNMSWTEIAEVLADEPLDDPSLRRAAARERKRFERLKERLRASMHEGPHG